MGQAVPRVRVVILLDTIYKYPLKNSGLMSIDMPCGARVLSVGVQDNKPVLWALVNTQQDPESRSFVSHRTGSSSVWYKDIFIGTAILDEGTYVCHIFEVV